MKRTGMFLLLALAIGCSGVELKEFSPDGKFKVLMPGSPEDNSKSAMGLQIKIWASKVGGSGVMLTSVTELPPGADAGNPDAVLDGAAKGQMGSMGATVTKTTNITLNNKYPGRALEGTVSPQGGKPGTASSRIYLVKNRLYQLLTLGEGGFAGSADSAKFLESLQIISE